jgi:diadenosine tetraphosphatase ApaH/serine/threonine PP2A family protein phosphatase
VKDESVHLEMGDTIRLEEGKKYFINCGSVGQPRDGNWRASYAVYDVNNKVVSIRRLDYDIKKTQDKILKAGLPEMLANRLTLGK